MSDINKSWSKWEVYNTGNKNKRIGVLLIFEMTSHSKLSVTDGQDGILLSTI